MAFGSPNCAYAILQGCAIGGAGTTHINDVCAASHRDTGDQREAPPSALAKLARNSSASFLAVAVHEAAAELGDLAADLGVDVVGEPVSPPASTSVRPERRPPLGEAGDAAVALAETRWSRWARRCR